MAALVNFALLYRTPREWRISVGTPEELSCGHLVDTPASGAFEEAAGEFEALLEREWGVTGPFAWNEFKPDWWGVDLVPGALAASAEMPW